jgi:hypothetical protein
MLRFCPLLGALLLLVGLIQAQEIPQSLSQSPARDRDKDYIKQRDQWFNRGRLMPGRSSAELRRRAYQSKLQMRTQRAAARLAAAPNGASLSTGSWIPLGPLPLASDASGNGTQDYRQVAGRVTAVAIDPADPTGNTVYIGAAQGGVWKSTNAAYSVADNVAWSPLTDNQATLSIGSLAIQPGNADPSRSVILAATGEKPTTRVIHTSDLVFCVPRTPEIVGLWHPAQTMERSRSPVWVAHVWHSPPATI